MLPHMACIALLTLVACSTATSEKPQLRVLTVNLLTFAVAPDEEARTQIVIDLIRRENPDLIALQEAGQSQQIENRAEVIAAATGYHFVWTSIGVDIDADYQGGPAVLSRWPILSQEIIALPHLSADGVVERKAIRVTSDTPMGAVNLVGIHTTPEPDEQHQIDQAVEGAELLARSLDQLPGFIAGDFNAEPGSAAMQALRGTRPQGAASIVLEDAWQSARPADTGLTYPSRNPARRIDYIYAAAGAQSQATPLDCRLVLQEALEGLYASDHLGVLCDFRFDAIE